MSHAWVSYEVLLTDPSGKIVDRYDNVRKNPVKRVFNELYVKHGFGGVTGQYERATIAINEGTVSTNKAGWTLRIETSRGRSYLATNN